MIGMRWWILSVGNTCLRKSVSDIGSSEEKIKVLPIGVRPMTLWLRGSFSFDDGYFSENFTFKMNLCFCKLCQGYSKLLKMRWWILSLVNTCLRKSVSDIGSAEEKNKLLPIGVRPTTLWLRGSFSIDDGYFSENFTFKMNLCFFKLGQGYSKLLKM